MEVITVCFSLGCGEWVHTCKVLRTVSAPSSKITTIFIRVRYNLEQCYRWFFITVLLAAAGNFRKCVIISVPLHSRLEVQEGWRRVFEEFFKVISRYFSGFKRVPLFSQCYYSEVLFLGVYQIVLNWGVVYLTLWSWLRPTAYSLMWRIMNGVTS